MRTNENVFLHCAMTSKLNGRISTIPTPMKQTYLYTYTFAFSWPILLYHGGRPSLAQVEGMI